MVTVKKIYDLLNEFAPVELAGVWDNVGILVGDENTEVTGILFALDLDIDAIKIADDMDANLIITHHPVIFDPLKNVNCKNPTSKVIYKAISKNMNIISMHTNLDAADEGVSYTLAKTIGLTNIKEVDSCNTMRVGELPKAMELMDFVTMAKANLNIDKADISKYQVEKVKRVAVVSGRGCSLLEEAKATNCDVFFLGEIKHENSVYANVIEQCVIACGHHETEVIILDSVKKYLQKRLDGVKLKMDAYDRAPTVRV